MYKFPFIYNVQNKQSYRDRKKINGCLEMVCPYVNKAILKAVGRNGLAENSQRIG